MTKLSSSGISVDLHPGQRHESPLLQKNKRTRCDYRNKNDVIGERRECNSLKL